MRNGDITFCRLSCFCGVTRFNNRTLLLASRGTGLVLDLFQELDEKLAGAIQKVLEGGGIAGIEPPNPLQQALAQMLIGKMQENVPQRDPNGQFTKNLE